MSALPSAAAVSNPVDDTVAIDGALDCQVAWLVTSVLLPLRSTAIAVNCRVSPGETLVPAAAESCTLVVFETGAVGEPEPHPINGSASVATHTATTGRL